MSAGESYHTAFSDLAAKKNAVALCRLPGTSAIHLFAAAGMEPGIAAVPASGSHFAFSPFGGGDHALTLPLTATFEYSASAPVGEPAALYPGRPNETASREDYVRFVDRCINAIRAGEFAKLVAARCTTVSSPPPFNAVSFFDSLCRAYPAAFVYLVSSADTGTWMGASPETLLRAASGSIETMALAGTRPSGKSGTWGGKEIEEHRLVEEFIAQAFIRSRLHTFTKTEPQTSTAGPISHLQSLFSWAGEGPSVCTAFGALLRELNPTPAVCGMPAREAQHFLEKNEGFERRFYSGFTGMLTPEVSHLFVNLRCMEILDRQVLLYAGAGITADSVPESEWNETEKKLDTLRTLL